MYRFNDRYLKTLPCPDKGNKIYYDTKVTGLGLRITAAGAKSFVFNYRIHGRERRLTLGRYGPDQWTLQRARKRAGELRRMIDNGVDPLGEREEKRTAPTMADLCQRFVDDHGPKLRPKTLQEYEAIIRNYILPALRHRKVAEVAYDDVDGLHRKITKAGATYRANRTVAILSKMFALAIKWRWRADNPAKGIERNQEHKRHRYLSADELLRLTTALAKHDDQDAANIIRLLLLTGARRGEVMAMRWADLDLVEAGVWTKPGSTTKQKTEHRVPLSDAACQLLRDLRAEAATGAEFVFSGRYGGHRIEIKQNWGALCKAAGITGARLHDLRHTYASVLASAGLSLPVIGALLGHTQPQTTARYAHLFDDPLRAATERAADLITRKESAEIVEMGTRK